MFNGIYQHPILSYCCCTLSTLATDFGHRYRTLAHVRHMQNQLNVEIVESKCRETRDANKNDMAQVETHAINMIISCVSL